MAKTSKRNHLIQKNNPKVSVLRCILYGRWTAFPPCRNMLGRMRLNVARESVTYVKVEGHVRKYITA